MNMRSIHVRLILWYTALIIVTSVGFGAYTYYSLDHRLYTQMQNTLARRIENIRDNILPEITSNKATTLSQQLRELYSPEESSRFIRIYRDDGDVIYISGTPKDNAFDPSAVSFFSGYSAVAVRHIEQAGNNRQLLIVGLKTATSIGDYVIEMGAPTVIINSALHKLIITLLIGLPVVVVIAVLGGFILVRRALQPVETIRATAQQITFSNLRQRLPIEASGDAIENLSVTLNQMLERLDLAYQQASRFSADASHELRTPLTIMRSELELIENTMRAWQLPFEFRERIGSVMEETGRLSGIVEGLFALARLDAGEAKIENKSLNLAELVKSTVEQMQLLAEDKHISLNVDAPLPVLVVGDVARIRQVVVNLLDNAIKYTLAGGTITISTEPTDQKAILRVKDNGIGISYEALPHVFERFYRADKARSRVEQGAGLGLSIVRAICEAHGGTVGLQSVEGTGTIVTIEFPRADQRKNLNVAA